MSSAAASVLTSRGPTSLFVQRSIALRLRRVDRHRESLARVVEADVRDLPIGQAGRCELEFLQGIDHGQAAVTVLVYHVGDVAAVDADIETIDIPRKIRRNPALLVTDRVDIAQLGEVAVLDRDEVDATAVRRELRRVDADFAAAVIDGVKGAGRDVGNV